MAPRKATVWRELWLFLLIAYGFSWAFWVPEALLAQGVLTSDRLRGFLDSRWNIAAFGPTVAAVIVVSRRSGIGGAMAFLRAGMFRRFGWVWLLPVLGLFPVLACAALVMATGWDGMRGASPLLASPGAIPAAALTVVLFSGPLQEEFGWRGFALPLLQQRYAALTSALFVGLVWAGWHLPLNFASGVEGPQYSTALPLFLGSIVTLTLVSVLMAWVYNGTGGSVLAAILMHGSMNLSTFVLFPVFSVPESLGFYTGLILIAALAVILIARPGHLARGGRDRPGGQ